MLWLFAVSGHPVFGASSYQMPNLLGRFLTSGWGLLNCQKVTLKKASECKSVVLISSRLSNKKTMDKKKQNVKNHAKNITQNNCKYSECFQISDTLSLSRFQTHCGPIARTLDWQASSVLYTKSVLFLYIKHSRLVSR